MYTSTILTSALAALVVTAPTASRSSLKAIPSNLFALKTIHRNSSRTEFSKYLSSYHVGAGQSVVIGTNDFSQSPVCYIDPNAGLLTEYTPSTSLPPATVGVERRVPYNSSAPAGSNYISLNNGSGGTKGWVVIPNPDGAGRTLQYEGDAFHGSGPQVKTFAICKVKDVAPYSSSGPQYQFLWESITSVSKYEKCAGVSQLAEEVLVPVKN